MNCKKLLVVIATTLQHAPTTRIVPFSTSRCRLEEQLKWSSGEPMKDAERKRQASTAIRKQNWESYNLFGPLLKPARQPTRRRNSVSDDATTTDTDASEGESTVVVHLTESGFNDVDWATPMKTETVVARLDKAELELEELIQSSRRQLPQPERPTRDVRDLSVQAREGRDCHRVKKEENDDSDETGTRLLHSIRHFPLTNQAETVSSLIQSLSELETNGILSGFPSVTTILQRTMPPDSVLALEKWRKKMTDQLGIEGFQVYQEELFRVGKALHLRIQRHLSGRPSSEIEVADGTAKHWKSLQRVLGHISEVSLLEARIRHPVLHYCGVLDCVAKYRDVNVLIEWKTSQRPKSSLEQTYDNPLQVAAYIGALNFSGLLDFQVTSAAIVVSYACGSPADVHYLNTELCQHYWGLWLERMCKYATLG